MQVLFNEYSFIANIMYAHKNESDSQQMLLSGLLTGRKDDGREIFISGGEEKTRYVQERKSEGADWQEIPLWL